MAMLAGPRQRKRYNLVPKGKALFEDSDRFGTKMLEKMGWTKGKGLGSKETGQQEFIRIRYKNDANGLGYEDRDDQWTEHEKHFNGLLESLHTGDSNSNTASGDDGDDSAPRVGFGFEKSKASKDKLKDKFSGQSLEERSKKSKARVHYKKFTKGKDMAQYSEKDLANIFGKKATAEENDFYSQLPSFNGGNEENDETEKQPTFELGTHTINTGLSVSDYFKMKMEALKNKKNVEEKKEIIANGEEQAEVMDVTNETEDDSTESSRKKKKKSKKLKSVDLAEKENGFETNSEEADLKIQETADVVENGEEEPIVLKPKKKKSKKTPVGEQESNIEDVIVVEDETTEESRPKKKKKKKSVVEPSHDQTSELSSIPVEPVKEADTSAIPSKKKESKEDATEERADPTDVPEPVSVDIVTEEVSQKKKKGKKRKAEDPTESLANGETDVPQKKKKTKEFPEDEPEPTIHQQEPTQKTEKKKKNKPQSTSEETPIDDSVLTESNSKKSKKKSKTLPDTDTEKNSAKKFRNVDLASFHGSNVSQLNGYGLSENLELKIVRIAGDRNRILKLWSGESNKYQDAVPKREIYQNYMMKAKQARKQKKKIPKMKVKPLHRLSAFQSL